MAASIRLVPCRSCGFHKFPINRLSKRCLQQASTKSWKSVVGLEIHAQILSESKLFSGSSTSFGGAINNQVSFFDAALPGTLPVLNRRCVEAGVMTALALDCRLNNVSKFDRKHYFYADLPQGYQITQQRQPLAVGGEVSYVMFTLGRNRQAVKHKAKLIQVQLEQDSGKSLHDLDDNQSLIDLNRAGVGLMEIVTEPEFSHGEDAAAFVKELQRILQTLGTCDGKMSEGSLRVDANISVHKPGEALGVRSEVKNINSIRSVSKAIDYEIKRHIKELEAGREIVNETRSYDVEKGVTVSMRDKEKLLDYRFMPEPNLPPLHLYDSQSLPESVRPDCVVMVDKLQASLPQLPREKRARVERDYCLPASVAHAIVNEEGLMEYFEAVIKDNNKRHSQSLANLLCNDVLGHLNTHSYEFTDCPIPPSQCGQLYDMFAAKQISSSTLRKVLVELCERPDISPQDVVETNNWYQITDPDTLKVICTKVMEQYPKSVTLFRAGKKSKLIGQIQREAEGRADPDVLVETLDRILA